MRASVGVVLAIGIMLWSCGPSSTACLPGSDRCACVERACNSGLTCVNGTCFDLSSWLRSSAGSAGSAGLDVSMLPMIAVGVPTAGTDAPVCTAMGGDCAATACCDGTLCLLNTCAAKCAYHQDCVTGCCVVLDATTSVCLDPRVCAGAL